MAGNDYAIVYLANCTGVNASVSSDLIADTELAEGTNNIVPNRAGSGNLIKRLGMTEYVTLGFTSAVDNQLGSIYSGLYSQYYTDQGTNFYIRQLGLGTELYASLGYTTAYAPSWTTHVNYDLMVVSDPTTVSLGVKTSDGTTFSLIANLPDHAYCIESYNRYLFISTFDNAYDGYIRWATVETVETWPAVNNLNLANGRNLTVKALKRDGPNLIAFQDYAFNVVQGFGPTFNVVDNNPHVGCSDQASVVSTPFGLFWWSRTHGICWRKSSYQDIDFPMMRKMPELLTSIADWRNVNAVWVASESCIRFYVPWDFSYNVVGTRYDYFPLQDALYPSSGKGCSMTASCIYDNRVLLGGINAASTDRMYQESSATTAVDPGDDGTAITSVLNTKRMAHSTAAAHKTMRSVLPRVRLGSVATPVGTMSYKAFLDNSNTAAITYNITPSTTDIQEKRIGVNLQHRRVQHQLTDNLQNTIVEYLLLTETGTVDQLL